MKKVYLSYFEKFTNSAGLSCSQKIQKMACLFFVFFIINSASAQPGPGWEYYRTINLSPATPLANFQVKIILSAGQYNHMKTDGSDLRFYDNSNISCNYWIEKWDNTGTSTVWVKVASPGATSLSMYYGNPAAAAVSNGGNTFDFFDDFLGTSLSANWLTNATGGGSINVSGGEVSLNNINGIVSMYSAFTPASTSFVVEAKHRESGYYRNRFYATTAAKINNTANDVDPVGFDYGYFGATPNSSTATVYWNGNQGASSTMNAGTAYLTAWNITEGGNYGWSTTNYNTGANIYTNATTIAGSIRYLTFRVTENTNASTIVDWARVRKDGATIASSAGTETSNLPVPTITTLGSSSGCEGSNITINGTGFTTAFGVTVKIGGTPVTSIVSNNGSTIVAIIGSGTTGPVTVTTGGGTATSTGNFTVSQLPSVNAGPVLAAICQGNASAPLGGSIGGVATGGTWTSDITGGTFTPNATTLNATWTPPAAFSGTATLTLTATGGSCGSASASKTLVVNPVPSGSITVSSSSICEGSPVTFTAPAGYYSYTWKVGATTVQSGSGNTYTALNLINGATVTVIITTTLNCSTTITAPAVIVNSYPTGNFTVSENSGVAPNDNIICDSDDVNLAFDNASYSNYNFKVGGTSVYSGPNNYFTVNTLPAGMSSLSVDVTGPGGCIKTFGPKTITVTALPVATLTLQENSGTPDDGIICVGTPVKFTATVGFPNYNFMVDNVSKQSGSSNIYNTNSLVDGDFVTVMVTNGNNCSKSNGYLAITVKPLPAVPVITGSPTSFCSGGSVTLTSSTATTYQWYKNNVLISGATSQNYTATTSGDYTVSITNTNSCAAVSGATTVTVYPLPPVPTISASGSTAFCIGSNVVLTSSTATSYQWNLNGTVITGATSQYYTATASGNYTVTITNSNGCQNTSTAIVVTVNPLPANPTISANGPTSFCDGGNVKLTSSSATTYQWYKDNNIIAGATSQNYTVSTSGDYTVAITNGNGCGAASAITSVTVNPLPDPTLTGPNPICPGSLATYTTETGNGINSYIWTYNGGTLISGGGTTDNTITIQWDVTAGAKGVFVNYKNSFGCSASEAKTVTTSNNPLPTITGPANVCINYAGNVYTTETGNGEHTYVWTIIGGTITAGGSATDNTATVTWTTAGTQSISVNYSNVTECTAVSPTKKVVTVKDLPVATFSYTNGSYCNNGADPLPTLMTGAQNGTWSSTAGLSINSANGKINVSASTPGTYTVTNTIATSGGCNVVVATSDVTITALPSAAISYTGTPFCTSDATNEPVTIAGTGAYTGGTYSSSAGLTINSSTGAVNPASSTPGNYTIIYTIPASGGCATVAASVNIKITVLPTASISYTGTPFCSSVTASQPVNVSGTGAYTGGNYSAPAGLSINTSTGSITPSASTPGTYMVTYTTPAANGCGTTITNTSVTITDVPMAVISYAGTPFCTTASSAIVTLSGSGAYTNGTYGSTAGLVINTTTGTINPSASTAGVYTITYTITSSGGCAAVPVTTTVTITAKPVVDAGDPVATCASGTSSNITLNASASNYSSVIWTSSGTGTFNNANSLTTATYTPSAADKIAGSVTLTLTATGNGNCASVSSAKILTINTNPAPVVIKPDNPVFCLGGIAPLSSVKDAVTTNQVVFSSTVNTTIPDNNFTGLSKSVSVSGIPANAIIDSIRINFNITHDADVDLTGNITSPNGNTLNLFNSLTGSNYTNTTISSASSMPIQTFGTAPYTGTFGPNAVVGALGTAFATSFSNLYTTAASLNGNWTFRVADNGVGDVGTFNSWSVTINYSLPIVPVPVVWTPYTDLYKDAAATVPYTGDTVATVYTKPSTQGTKMYTATSSSSAGCTTATTITVTVKPSPSVFITADYCSNPGYVTLTANTTNASSFNWSNGATTQTTLVDIAKKYYVSASNTSGCVGTNVIDIAQELVVNGDFTQGNVGFTTGYAYKPDIAGVNNELVPDDSNNGYGVGISGQNYHPNFYGEDHTNNQSGPRNFMLVNGHGTITVWQETVTVQPNTYYYYSAWGMNLNPASPARLQFQVNGVNIGTIADLNTAQKPTSASQVNLNNWVRFYYGNTNGWYSGSNTTATIRIVDLNSDLGGNDFGLDDISFATLSPFVTGPAVPGSNNQVVCAETPIDSITYKVGSGASGPQVTGLPAGVISTFDGLNLVISGSPTMPGTYKYIVATTGSCPNPKADSGIIIVNPKATISLTSAGNNIQSVCINSNINAVTYSIGGGGSGAQFINLPAGVTGSFLNGTATISGAPSVAGTFNFIVKTSGTCKQDSLLGTLTVSDASNAGMVSSPTICIGNSGTLTLNGNNGSILQWESSLDGITFTTIANTTTSQGFTNVSQTTFYRALIKNAACPSAYSTGGKIQITNLWEGKNSADWNNPSNWSSGNLPNSSCSGTVTIPQVPVSNYNPVLTATASIINLNILTNGNLTVNGSGKLRIAGTVTNTGIFDVTAGVIEFNGTALQTIAANEFTTNKIKDLIISNSVSLNGVDSLTGTLSFGSSNKTFTTNGNLTIKSTINATGAVGKINSGNSITGDVTVERYIATGSGSAPNHGKSWQLLAVPTMGQSINQAWQEGATVTNISSPLPGSAGNPVKGYGTMLTSGFPNAVALGYDVYTAAGPSLKIYNINTEGYDGVGSTTGTPLYNKKGYFIFVRGDRSVYTSSGTATPTVLRSRGTLFTPLNAPPVSHVEANKFESIGNPYASPVDMRLITRTGGVQEFFQVWDPRLGGAYNYGAFQTFSLNGAGTDYVVTPGGGSYGAPGSVNNFIQSGQAFFMQAAPTPAGGGDVSFNENAKAGGYKLFSAPPVPLQSSGSLRTTLFNATANANLGNLIDGTLANFSDAYNNEVDGLDARKSANTGEELSIRTGGKLLVIERRHTIVTGDTIFLNTAKMKARQYVFHFDAQDFNVGLLGYVEDTYLHSRTLLNLNGTTDVNFSVENVNGSYAADRFRIVFAPAVVLPVTFTSVKAYHQDKEIDVEWKVENELNIRQYEVEKSMDGRTFKTLAIKAATANAGRSAVYMAVDISPVADYNYYRVKSVDINGKTAYTSIVKVLIGTLKQDITIYPNPITDGMVHLQLLNQPGGTYKLRLLNKLGQTILSKQIAHVEGSSTEFIKWDFNLAHGMYQLEITKPGGEVKIINVLY